MPNSELTKSAAWVTLGHLVATLGSFVSLMVLARILTPDDFGLFGLSLIIIMIPESLIGGQLQEVLIQYRGIKQRHISSMLGFSTLLGLIAGGAVMLGAPFFAGLFDAPGLKQLLPVMAVILVMHGMTSTAAALMIREMNFSQLTIVDIVGTLVAAAVGVGFVLQYNTVWALVWMEMTRRVVRLVMFVIFSKIKFDFSFHRAAAAEIYDYARKAVSAGVVRTIERVLPGALIGYGLGTVALGYYNVALRLLEQAVSVLVEPLSNVSFPVFAKAQADMAAVREQLRNAVYLAALVAAPAFGGSIVAAPTLVPVLFGDQWMAVIPLAQLSFLTGIALTISGINYALLNGIGYPGKVLKIMILTTIATFVGVVSVLNISIVAVMAIILFKTLFMWALTAREVKKLAGQPFIDQVRPMFVPLAATLIMMGVTHAFYVFYGVNLSPVVSLLATVVIGVLVYPAALFAIKPSLVGFIRAQVKTRLAARKGA